jgi:hypothetical protein
LRAGEQHARHEQESDTTHAIAPEGHRDLIGTMRPALNPGASTNRHRDPWATAGLPRVLRHRTKARSGQERGTRTVE